MSNLADPGSTARFTFENAAGTTRVRIRARFLTERQLTRHEELWESAKPLDLNSPEFVKLRDEMLLIGIVEPGLDELKDKLSRLDLMQLAVRYPDHVVDIEAQLGKSRSRPQFIQEPSAVDAAAASAITSPAASATLPTSEARSS